MKYKYLFGPILSRRLGISLGVDLVEYKICNLDCVYCEVGETSAYSTERKEYIPTQEIIKEIEAYLSKSPDVDFITFSGAGEPTLHRDLGKIIDYIKINFKRYKVALITNGTLFSNQELIDEVKNVDVILPNLDAVSEIAFNKINRPDKSLKIAEIIDGLINLRAAFKNEIWLEIFIVPGINDSSDELLLLKNEVVKINPDRVQINTIDRPGAETWIKKPDQLELEKIADFFKPFKVDIIAKYNSPGASKIGEDSRNIILETLRRRPCTMKEISETLNLHINIVNKIIADLLSDGIIVTAVGERGVFYLFKNK